jgi:hypothetical protein
VLYTNVQISKYTNLAYPDFGAPFMDANLVAVRWGAIHKWIRG